MPNPYSEEGPLREKDFHGEEEVILPMKGLLALSGALPDVK